MPFVARVRYICVPPNEFFICVIASFLCVLFFCRSSVDAVTLEMHRTHRVSHSRFLRMLAGTTIPGLLVCDFVFINANKY